jgi:lysophospholipase
MKSDADSPGADGRYKAETESDAFYADTILPWFSAAKRTGEFRSTDAVMLRWLAVEAAEERGALVILPGFMEMAESFAEELYELRDLGLSFYVLDHRAQGLSGSEIEPRDRWHVEDWRSLVDDADLFLREVVGKRPHRRVLLYGNSMGGAVATALLARNPAAAEALLLVVPMFGILTPPFPISAMACLAWFRKRAGRGKDFFPGNGPYRREPFEGNSWSIASRERYLRLDRLNETRAEYRMGGITSTAALELVRLSRAAAKAAADITAPVLLIKAGRDGAVSNREQDRAVRSMRAARIVRVEDAHHPIMHDLDPIRGEAITAIRGFLRERTT